MYDTSTYKATDYFMFTICFVINKPSSNLDVEQLYKQGRLVMPMFVTV